MGSVLELNDVLPEYGVMLKDVIRRSINELKVPRMLVDSSLLGDGDNLFTDLKSVFTSGGTNDLLSAFMTNNQTLYSSIVQRIDNMFHDGKWAEKNSLLVFVEGLMYDTVCYVEYFTDGRRQKYLVCRNESLLNALTGSKVSAIARQELVMDNWAIQEGYVKAHTISLTKRGFNLGKSVYSLPVDKIMCIPLFMLDEMYLAICDLLQKGVYAIDFYKDNGMLRTLETTLSKTVWTAVYGEVVDLTDLPIGLTANRGYMTVPMFGGSIHETNLTRSVNIARIKSIRRLATVDVSLVKLDIDNVKPLFESVVLELIRLVDNQDTSAIEAVASLIRGLNITVSNQTDIGAMWKSQLLNVVVMTLQESSSGGYQLYKVFRSIPYIVEKWSIFGVKELNIEV